MKKKLKKNMKIMEYVRNMFCSIYKLNVFLVRNKIILVLWYFKDIIIINILYFNVSMKIFIILIENIHKNNYLNENFTEKNSFRIISFYSLIYLILLQK